MPEGHVAMMPVTFEWPWVDSPIQQFTDSPIPSMHERHRANARCLSTSHLRSEDVDHPHRRIAHRVTAGFDTPGNATQETAVRAAGDLEVIPEAGLGKVPEERDRENAVRADRPAVPWVEAIILRERSGRRPCGEARHRESTEAQRPFAKDRNRQTWERPQRAVDLVGLHRELCVASTVVAQLKVQVAGQGAVTD